MTTASQVARLEALVALVAILAACGPAPAAPGQGSPPAAASGPAAHASPATSTPDPATPLPEPATPVPDPATPTPATASAGATATMAGGPYGPLAVVPPSDGSDMARNEGVIHLSGSCATITGRRAVTLLVWPADLVRWNPADHTVTFRRVSGETVTIADGQAVVVGGSGDRLAEMDMSAADWIGTVPWVARPAGGCGFDAFWFVGDIEAAG